MDRIVTAIQKAITRLPNEVAALAVDFSKQRFRHQAWLDTKPEKWAARKRKRKGGRNRSQTLLVDTGRLRRSIRKIEASSSRIVIGTDVPYAEAHNEGASISSTVKVPAHNVRGHNVSAHSRTRNGRRVLVKKHAVKTHNRKAHTRKMNTKLPARRFIGNSTALARTIERHIKISIEKALRE